MPQKQTSFFRGVKVEASERDAPHDPGKDIVEVVRHSSGEHPQRLQPLGVKSPVLQLVSVGCVGEDDQSAATGELGV